MYPNPVLVYASKIHENPNSSANANSRLGFRMMVLMLGLQNPLNQMLQTEDLLNVEGLTTGFNGTRWAPTSYKWSYEAPVNGLLINV